MRHLYLGLCLIALSLSMSSCGKAETTDDFVVRLSQIVENNDEAALWSTFINKKELKKLMTALPGMLGTPTNDRINELWGAMSEDKGNMLRRFTSRFDIPWWTMQPDSSYLEFAPDEMVLSKNVEPAQLYLVYRQGNEKEDFSLSIVRFGNSQWKLFNYPDR